MLGSPHGLRSLGRAIALLAAILALALGLSACGGGADGKTIATVGHAKVSQATINHWMTVVLGGDYAAALDERAPDGLVSDPVDYSRCASVAARIVPKVEGKPRLSSAQLLQKCRQLNAAIREQALAYVLSVLWSQQEGVERGLKAPTEAQINGHLRALIYSQFKSPANFQKVIAKQRRNLADVRFLIKRNVIQTQITAKLKAQAEKLGGGEPTIYKLVLQSNAHLSAKTSCSPGYRAWECKQYGSAGEAKPPAAVVLERLSKGVE
jgi:hypothetical protein